MTAGDSDYIYMASNTMNGANVLTEEFVEERILMALVTGPLEKSEVLLDGLVDVDARMSRQRTLLHVGVSLGKADWVEELLARGADPDLKENSHVTALGLAEEMLGMYPDECNRREVLRLVRLVHRREKAMRRGIETSSGGSALNSTSAVIQTEHVTAMAALSSSVDALKKDICSLRAEMRSSLEKLKEQVCGRDALLQCLEAAVTSSAEQLMSLNGRLQRETTLGAFGTTLENPLPMSSMADMRRECVDAMIKRTVFVCEGKKEVNRVQMLYERIYDEDDATGCLLQFLNREPRFVAKVDCGSSHIGRMRKTFVSLDGKVKSGSDCNSFAEFSSNTVYLGAKVGCYSKKEVAGWFAKALAQMSLHLCFRNGGKPYEDGDKEHEREWNRAFEEVEEKRNRGLGLGLCERIHWALNKNTQTARESCLAASVPWVIAEFGSTEGARVLQKQVPRLLNFYREHVVATLIAKARE